MNSLKIFAFVFLLLSITAGVSAQKSQPETKMDNLADKVKTMTVNLQRPGDKAPVKQYVRYYDAKGFVTKHEWFSTKGEVAITIGFGFENGKRASGYETVDKADKTKRIVKYNSYYTYTYDKSGRKIAEKVVNEKGEQSFRNEFVFEGDAKTSREFNNENRQIWQVVEKLDSRGNVIQQTRTMIGKNNEPNPFGQTEISVKYNEFDAKGNWTKRTISDIKDVPPIIETRAIVYWK